MSDMYARLAAALNSIYPGYEELRNAEKHPPDWLLASRGVFTEVELLKIYSEAAGVECFDEDTALEPVMLPDVPKDYWENRCCLPMSIGDDEVGLLICDPYSLNAHRVFFKELHGLNVNCLLARRSLLERAIAELYRARAEEEIDLDNEETLRNLASEGTVVRLVNEMTTEAAERRASDIHVEPEEDSLIIRFRIDGVLHEYLTCPLAQYPAVASRIKLIAGLNIAESRVPQDGRTSIRLGRSDIDIRISTIPTMNGESIVLRLLKKDSVSFDLAAIGMDEQLRHDFERLIRIPHGIILVVGPTGSGKSTTLYSVVSLLNDHSNKIITIEDPVEYKLPRLTQMQVNPQLGVTFAAGLRSIVRQDPDIILVGEIRDRETAEIAINAALTGHLVLSTLHTNDAAGAISRLLDMGVEDFLLASALYGVLSQRLVRRICEKCKNSGILAGAKCKNCGGTGFRGRTGIFELLSVDDDIRKAIIERKSNAQIAEIAVEKGMTTLIENGMARVAAGVTTEAEVKRSASEL